MSGLSYITTCNLCGQQFTHNGLVGLLHGNLPAAVKVFDGLKRHIESDHKMEDARAQLAAQALLGLLRIQHFSSQDTGAMELRDFQRWQLAEMTRKNHCGDDKIVQQVSALSLPDEYTQTVINMVRLMRDIIEERGRFQPKAPGDVSPASKSAGPKLVV